ncbi:MAG: MoxR family ATPase [Pseudomonadota bacterium]|nr:MoxR family ATPase [Pseudomonadota bacterium]
MMAGKVSELDKTAIKLKAAREELGKIVFGQESVIDLALITILAGGHGLIVGAPGLAKTKLAASLGTVLGLAEKRIQFTPDLMPADILGAEILDADDKGKRAFRFVKGPVFAQLLMADEINRASPRTQSALLQAMQEHIVTVAGHHHALPEPFHVLATQNPIEQEGTYPLPEAQLDRFLMQIDISYPPLAAEREMLLATTGAAEATPNQVLTAAELQSAQSLVRDVPVGEQVTTAILNTIRAARPGAGSAAYINDAVAWGPSPRAAQSLMLCVKARALLHGRLSPSVDDVIALLEPVLKHRMALNFSARAEGVTVSTIIAKLAATLA